MNQYKKILLASLYIFQNSVAMQGGRVSPLFSPVGSPGPGLFGDELAGTDQTAAAGPYFQPPDILQAQAIANIRRVMPPLESPYVVAGSAARQPPKLRFKVSNASKKIQKQRKKKENRKKRRPVFKLSGRQIEQGQQLESQRAVLTLSGRQIREAEVGETFHIEEGSTSRSGRKRKQTNSFRAGPASRKTPGEA